MPLPRMRLTTFLFWVFLIGLILGLAIQLEVVRRREQAANAQVMSMLRGRVAQIVMAQVLGDQAIDILKQSTGAELLRVPKSKDGRLPDVSDFQSTGIPVEDGLSFRVACSLLDHRNFGYTNSDDDPVPQVGLRFRRGAACLDLFFSSEGSTPASPHQDVWIKVNDPAGNVVHRFGRICMYDPDLQKLVEVLLKR